MASECGKEERSSLPPAAKCYLKRIALLPEEDTHTFPRCLPRATPTRFVGRPSPNIEKSCTPPACLRPLSFKSSPRGGGGGTRAAPELAALRSPLLPRCNCEYHPPPTQKGWAMLSCMEEGLKNYFITTHVISALVASTSTKILTYGKTCSNPIVPLFPVSPFGNTFLAVQNCDMVNS